MCLFVNSGPNGITNKCKDSEQLTVASAGFSQPWNTINKYVKIDFYFSNSSIAQVLQEHINYRNR
jgi:hypothetical protein